MGDCREAVQGLRIVRIAIERGQRFDALVLFDPPNVPAPGHPVHATMVAYEHKLADWARQVGTPLRYTAEPQTVFQQPMEHATYVAQVLRKLAEEDLRQRGLLQSDEMHQLPHGSTARVAGLVTCRQRPDTASGVVFVTLEDETGNINVVVWNRLVERQRRELLGARLLGVHGSIERDGEVVHLVARRLVDYSALLGPLETASRDFH